MKKILVTAIAVFMLLSASRASAGENWEINILHAPNISYDYRAEGNNSPPSYTAKFSGMRQLMNSFEAIRRLDDNSRVGIVYMHGGTSQFVGEYGIETVGDYQSAKLNTGFSNFMVSYYKKIAGLDMEYMFNISVMRQMFSRKDFEIGGVTYEQDDDNEISGEGLGFGIRGQLGDDYFLRYKAISNFYIQVHDTKTDKELGEYFSCELSTGYRYKKAAIEFGYMYLYMFMHSQTNRRLYLDGEPPAEALISWSQQDMTIDGAFLRLSVSFD